MKEKEIILEKVSEETGAPVEAIEAIVNIESSKGKTKPTRVSSVYVDECTYVEIKEDEEHGDYNEALFDGVSKENDEPEDPLFIEGDKQ